MYNVGVIAPIGSTTVSNHALRSRAVGRDFGAPSVTFKFTTVGTYGYRCLFHPGMYGKIVVLPPTTPVRSAAMVKAHADAMTLAGWTTARQLIAAHRPANTVVTGPEKNGVTVFAFAPQTVHVKVGATVEFLAGSATEPHNVGFGPLAWLRGFIVANDKFPTGPTSPNQVDPVLVYGSDTGTITHSKTAHGNGFVGSRALDRAAGTPLPRVARITFTEAGTYTYYCMIHFPFMHGKVIVEP
jgi:plastocyanin